MAETRLDTSVAVRAAWIARQSRRVWGFVCEGGCRLLSIAGAGAAWLGCRARWAWGFVRANGRYLVSIVGSVVATVVVLLVPAEYYARLEGFGYLGVFLLTMLSSATVIFPSPTLAAAWAFGAILSPPLVGLLAGLGAALGELTGYLLGYGGSALAARSRYYKPVRRFVDRYGLVAIFVFALIPNPLFDLAGIAAGAVRIPYWRFLLVCFLGKAVRFVVIAYLGRWVAGVAVSWPVPVSYVQ